MEPQERKLGTDTWYYAKRCLLATIGGWAFFFVWRKSNPFRHLSLFVLFLTLTFVFWASGNNFLSVIAEITELAAEAKSTYITTVVLQKRCQNTLSLFVTPSFTSVWNSWIGARVSSVLSFSFFFRTIRFSLVDWHCFQCMVEAFQQLWMAR